MKDILSFFRDLTDSAAERLKFPLFNSFIVSWLVVNWKPVFIVLFSDKPMEERIVSVQEYSSFANKLWIPLGIAFGYIVIVPLVKKGLFWCLAKINAINRDDAVDYVIGSYEKRMTLAENEYKLQSKKAEYLDVRALNEKIETLKAELEKSAQENIELEKRLQHRLQELTSKSENIGDLQEELNHKERRLELKANDYEELIKRYDGLVEDLSMGFLTSLKSNPEIEVRRVNDILSESGDKLDNLRRELKQIKKEG